MFETRDMAGKMKSTMPDLTFGREDHHTWHPRVVFAYPQNDHVTVTFQDGSNKVLWHQTWGSFGFFNFKFKFYYFCSRCCGRISECLVFSQLINYTRNATC